MSEIFEKLNNKIELWRREANEIMVKGGEKVLSEVKVSQAFGGMRGVTALICDTSRVPQDQGLIVRGRTLKEIANISPEEVYYLLLTGDLPNAAELNNFSENLKTRKFVPDYVWNCLKAMPKESHPMTMLSIAIMILQNESLFAREYAKGIRKEDYWKPTLEDSLNLVAKIPSIAAAIYRIRFGKGQTIEPNPEMDLTGDYVHMLDIKDANKEEFNALMKLYLVAHCDHEGGNVSAFANQTINSALSDVYLSLSGGINGLAGPLHGLANQECLKFIIDAMILFDGTPNKEQATKYVKETLEMGKVIPGYGHAVLRITDPRFDAFLDFGKKYFPEDSVFKTVSVFFEVVPNELKKIEKIKNPWPNVDAVSGSMLYHYGLKEFSYYTVVFAVSRSLGLTAQSVMNRALMHPIIRPKSITTRHIKDLIS